MRASTLLLASLLAVPSVSAQSASLVAGAEPSLTYSPQLRALDLVGEPGRPYLVVAGVERRSIKIPGGTTLDVAPIATLQFGWIGGLGHAYVPIDATGGQAAADPVFAQALLWPVDATQGFLPDVATGLAVISLIGPQTDRPVDPPSERITVVSQSAVARVTADLAVADGIPPTYLAVIQAEVPTGGHRLRIDDVRHAGTFTRVFATLERPGAGEVVTAGFETLQVIGELGIWVGDVEVVVREVVRETARTTAN